MARKGRVKLRFECADCEEKIMLTLFFGDKRIWNNSTSPTLQNLFPHQDHDVRVRLAFEPW